MRSSIAICLAFVVFATVVLASDERDEEVVDLSDKIGRRGKAAATVRRAGMGMQAFGASTVSFQGNFEEGEETEREELGSSARSVVARGSAFDWTKCESEGGTDNCALCDDAGGALPCKEASEALEKKKGDDTSPYRMCTDGNIGQNRMHWRVLTNGKTGRCNNKNTISSSTLRGAAQATWNFSPRLGDAMVVTKALVTRPYGADNHVGMFVFKRLVAHKCSKRTDWCAKGDVVMDTYKIGYCVACKRKQWSGGEWSQPTDDEKRAFFTGCFKTAFGANGEIEKDYRCKKEERKQAEALMASF